MEPFEGLDRVTTDRTTEGAVRHLGHIFISALLVASDKFATVSEYVVQQCGLSRAKKTRRHCGWYAGVAIGGAAQIVLSTRSQHDLTVTVKEAEGTRIGLDDVDLYTLQARHASHVDLAVGVSDVPLGLRSRLVLTQPEGGPQRGVPQGIKKV